MTSSDRNSTTTSDREIVISRVFDAPRELVFRAWTEPEHLINWWGPRGFTNTFHEIDVREGGVWRFVMHAPDGTNYDNRVVYSEVVPPSLIAYSHGDDSGEHFQVRVVFEDAGEARTQLTLRLTFATPEQRDQAVRDVGAIEGGNQTLDRLAEYLPSM